MYMIGHKVSSATGDNISFYKGCGKDEDMVKV